MSQRNAVVVGGGIAGIAAAMLLARKGWRVVLVEQAPRLGGLLGTMKLGDYQFDVGTHFVPQVGLPALDELLLAGVTPADWIEFPVLRSGTYFAGAPNFDSPCLDLRPLPPSALDAVVAELTDPRPPAPGPHASLQAQLLADYGPATCEHVFAPVLRKFMGQRLAELAPGTHNLFGLRRFIALTADDARRLKQNPAIDGRLAFHSFNEGEKAHRHYYPKAGGVGRWIEDLEARLLALGVTVAKGRALKGVAQAGRDLTEVTLDNGDRHAADLVVWSVPPDALLNLSGPAAPAKPLPHATMTLFQLVLDQAPLTDLYYFVSCDPRFATFRVTFYTGTQGKRPDAAGWHLSVEALTPTPEGAPADAAAVLRELKAMRLVGESASLLEDKRMQFGGGFPIMSSAFADNRERLIAQVEERFDNVLLVGKGNGRAFFTTDVLRDTFAAIEARG